MSWKNILGHERAKKILQRAVSEKKVASAYLFWGLEGIGKEALALEFAKTLNCLKPIVSNGEVSACDECRSCRQASSLNHQNIQMVFSLPAGKSGDSSNESPLAKLSDEQMKEINEQLRFKADNIYHKIKISNASQIRIASIREVKRNLSLSANSSGQRVVIVLNAEEMTIEASNAFLKTLEEPHQKITIILISSKKEMLLQTILSRCQQIHCEPVPEQIIAKYVMDNFGKSEAEAALIANFSQGSISAAVEFLDEDMQEMRKDIIDTLRASLKKNYRLELFEFLEKMIAAKNKNKVETSLKMLLIWMRDYYIYSKTGETNNLINKDQTDRIVKFAELFPEADVAGVLNEIEQAIFKIKRNVNMQLLLITLFLNIRRCLVKVDF